MKNFAISIAAERSPSLPTMTNKFETNKLTSKFVFEILKAIWLKMCQEMKEQAQAHYCRTILIEYPKYRLHSYRRMQFFLF